MKKCVFLPQKGEQQDPLRQRSLRLLRMPLGGDGHYRRPLSGGIIEKSRRNPQQDDETAVLPYTRSGAPRDGGRRAHQENDKAVMAAYGFKSNMEESEIVAELFRLYEGMVK